MTAAYTPAWASTLLTVLRLYAEHEEEGRPAPTRFDAYIALDMRPAIFAGARAALLSDGRLCEGGGVKRQGGGPSQPCTLTAAGWAAIGQTPPRLNSRGPRVRSCLCCGDDFASRGAGNRICPRCASSDVFAGGAGLAW